MKSSSGSGEVSALAALIKKEHEALMSQWRKRVRDLPSARNLDKPTLNDHVPGFLREFVLALESGQDKTEQESIGESSPSAHGLQRVEDGFNIEEVVAEYNILRSCIHDLADNNGLTLQGKPFQMLNQFFGEAIALAVQSYAVQQALEVQRHRGEYLAFVAHDLKTPLNAISLAVKVLELKLEKPSASIALMLKTLHRNVLRLDGLVDKVLEENANLTVELGIQVTRRVFDLWPLVAALIYDLLPVSGADRIRMINKVPDDLVVYADAGLLRRIFQNLITNAMRYAPQGEVTIGARELHTEGGVECWVTDDGAGIPEALLPKVFEKGESDPQEENGSLGLGLAIVKLFVESHGGKVTVESKEGHGATFRFSLPGEPGASGHSDQPSATAPN